MGHGDVSDPFFRKHTLDIIDFKKKDSFGLQIYPRVAKANNSQNPFCRHCISIHCISIHPSIHPSIQQSTHPSIHQSTHPSIHPSIHQPTRFFVQVGSQQEVADWRKVFLLNVRRLDPQSKLAFLRNSNCDLHFRGAFVHFSFQATCKLWHMIRHYII